jgi:hypothetical protein
MSISVKQKKRKVPSPVSSSPSSSSSPAASARPLLSPHAPMKTSELGAGSERDNFEEMGVGREARMKRFALCGGGGGSSSSSSSTHALYDENGFLQPVVGTVRITNFTRILPLTSPPISCGKRLR